MRHTLSSRAAQSLYDLKRSGPISKMFRLCFCPVLLQQLIRDDQGTPSVSDEVVHFTHWLPLVGFDFSAVLRSRGSFSTISQPSVSLSFFSLPEIVMQENQIPEVRHHAVVCWTTLDEQQTLLRVTRTMYNTLRLYFVRRALCRSQIEKLFEVWRSIANGNMVLMREIMSTLQQFHNNDPIEEQTAQNRQVKKNNGSEQHVPDMDRSIQPYVD